jgi:hypothetical protein
MSDVRNDLMEAAEDLNELNEGSEVEEAEEPDLPQTDEAGDDEEATFEEEAEETPEEEPVLGETEEDIPEPEQWVAEMRQRWASVPKDVRKYINQREAQMHSYISKIGGQFANMRKTFEDVDKALKPYDAELQKHNVSRGQIVERLLAERGEMMKDPSGFIKRFADMNRISLHDLASDPELNEPPEVRQARWQLRDQQSQIEAQRQGIAEQQRQIELGQLTDYVNNWGAAKPHFAEVRQAMAQIIPEIQQSYPYLSFEEQLETAYGAALRHPSFASLRKPQPVPQSVRRAASGVSGISGAPTRTKEPANIREALMQAAKETGYF